MGLYYKSTRNSNLKVTASEENKQEKPFPTNLYQHLKKEAWPPFSFPVRDTANS